MSHQIKLTGSQVFRGLMVRCLDHEFDKSVTMEHVSYLKSDIWEAFNQMDITEEERKRLLLQWQATAITAVGQKNKGERK